MPCVTIRRDDAGHRWPVEKNAPLTAHSTDVLRAASSSTASGFLPPISSWNLAIRATQALATLRPVETDPVKVMASTSRLFRNASPTTDRRPIPRLNPPLGNPEREMISERA